MSVPWSHRAFGRSARHLGAGLLWCGEVGEDAQSDSWSLRG